MFPRSRDEIERHLFSALGALTLLDIQGSAKRRALGCVNSLPAARGGQEAGFTQPRAHLLADPCT